MVFEKNANFFAENCQKWQKFAILKSTPIFVRIARFTIEIKNKLAYYYIHLRHLLALLYLYKYQK
jgi:hypothetical protein